MDEGGGETPSTSSTSNAASSSTSSSGSGRPHSAGAVFSFNIPLSLAGQSQDDDEDEDDDGEEEGEEEEEDDDDVVREEMVAQYLHETGQENGSQTDTMLFLLPSSDTPTHHHNHHHHLHHLSYHHSSRHHHHQPPESPQPQQPSVQSTSSSGNNPNKRQNDGSLSAENKENTAPNSPLVVSANYKQGNYFRFPDVDAWPTGAVKLNVDQLSSCSTPSDTLTIGILSPPDVVLPEAPRNSPMRRARLKSISLDSESAKVVEDNLNLGMHDLCLQPPPHPTAGDSLLLFNAHSSSGSSSGPDTNDAPGQSSYKLHEQQQQTNQVHHETNVKQSHQQQHHHRSSMRNKNQLKIDLKQEEFHLDCGGGGVDGPSGVDSRQHPPTPKTPTLTQSRQKAISLDSSDQGAVPTASTTSSSCCGVPTVSASVPTTPKRHLMLSTHQPHHGHHHGSASVAPISGTQSHLQQFKNSQGGHGGQKHFFHHHQNQQHQYQQQQQHNYHHQHLHNQQSSSSHHGHQTTNLLASSGSCRTKSRSTSEHLGSNLQRLKTVTLSVSNNNLKTLPEIMPLSDFGCSSTTSPPLMPFNSTAGAITPLDGPPTSFSSSSMAAVSPNVIATTPCKGRSSLLQRRGSNHSLTLNLAGSVGDLSGSTSHIVPSASGSGFGTKRGLLQRRGSNASLTLTIQGSDSALSRFNSHGSLNEGRVAARKSHLSVSNCNLRSTTDVSRLRSQPGSVRDKAGHHGKFFSSEENLNNNNVLSYCHIEAIDADEGGGGGGGGGVGRLDDMGSAELVDYDDDGVRQITTKPLSPQSTSEDFKIYLANIQYLQNATNVLHVDDIRDLGTVFSDLGAYQTREQILGGTEAEQRLTAGQEKHLNIQRRKLREIHQEFWDLPTNHQEKPMVFGSQHKNRYKTILPNEHSRVILKPEMEDLGKTEPYINANYIKGPTDGMHELNYIATQGPMANTVFDFWLMAMQDSAGELGPTGGNHTHNKSYSASCAASENQAAVPPTLPIIIAPQSCSFDGFGDSAGVGEKLYIIMLTNFVENGRPKCATYFPERLGQTLCFSSASGSESQCDATGSGYRMMSRSASYLFDETDEEGMKYREWYEQCVMDDAAADTEEWEWIKGLRRRTTTGVEIGEMAQSTSQPSESCFIVRNVRVRDKRGYSVRELLVKYINGPARSCTKFFVEHYWFPDWPDHKSPEDLSVVLDFALDLLKVPGLTTMTPVSSSASVSCGSMLRSKDHNIVGLPKVVLPILHCSAGIGRTGCMAGILNALRQMINSSGTPQAVTANPLDRKSSVSCQSQTVDILGIVCNLRLQRGGMVQNSEQYELIHRVLALYQQKVDEAMGILPPRSFLERDCDD